MTTETAHYVIVGAGMAGASAAWRLAESGAEVLVLERDRPASAQGSSHGSARIFRYGYPDPFYTDLVVRARSRWDELEAKSGTRLITPSGSLDFGAVRNPRALADVLAGAGVDHELLSRQAAKERWPQLEFDTEVLWHPGAGVIDAETTVNAMLDLARAAGARVISGWEVSSIAETPTGYSVHAADGRSAECAQVIVAAGPFLPALLEQVELPADFRARLPQFEVRQENAFHFPYRLPADTGQVRNAGQVPDGTAGGPTTWPTFIYKGPDMQVYSLPGGRDADFEGQKIAEYNAGKIMHSGYDQDGLIDPANRERVTDFVRAFAPGLDTNPYAETTCMFTNVPGDDMFLYRADGITVISPCSGQGAKFAPLFGELVADLVAGSGVPGTRFRATGQQFALA